MKLKSDVTFSKKETNKNNLKIDPLARRKSNLSLKISQKKSFGKSRNLTRKSKSKTGVNPQELLEQLLLYKSCEKFNIEEIGSDAACHGLDWKGDTNSSVVAESNVASKRTRCVDKIQNTPSISDNESDSEDHDSINIKNKRVRRNIQTTPVGSDDESDDGDHLHDVDNKERRTVAKIQTTPLVSDAESDNDSADIIDNRESVVRRLDAKSDCKKGFTDKQRSFLKDCDIVQGPADVSSSKLRDTTSTLLNEAENHALASLKNATSIIAYAQKTVVNNNLDKSTIPFPTNASPAPKEQETINIFEYFFRDAKSDSTKQDKKNPYFRPQEWLFVPPDEMDLDYGPQQTTSFCKPGSKDSFTGYNPFYGYSDTQMINVQPNDVFTFTDVEMADEDRAIDMEIDFQCSDAIMADLQIYLT